VIPEGERTGERATAPRSVLFYFRAALDAIAYALVRFLIAALAIMLGCIALQVFMRYFLGAPPSWAEEIALLCFTWSAMGAIALGVREGFHVRLEFYQGLPRRLRELWERVTHVVVAGLGLFLAWAGWRFVDITAGSRSAAARYPIELLHVAAPVAGALIFLFAIDRALGGSPKADRASGAEQGR
jgi:TRAP-type C4-dicarboxylate transport system permease small subunit